MSVDAVTGKIIQNRVNDKINYQTSFTDFTTFVEYCRYLKKIGPVASQKVNKVCGKRRSEFTPSWKNDKSDSHAKISLLQYGLIELNEQNYYVVSEIGDRFIALFDDDNNLVADREEFLNVTFDMICIWHQEGNGFDIHPGKMIIRLMLEPELHGYFTDQDLACICNDTDNRLDSQYEEIKEKVIAFRESGVIYTREEKKKTYTLLTGYANNWNIFELDEKSTNEIKIVHLCDDFRQLAIKRLSVMTEDKVPTDDELKTLIRGTDELSKSMQYCPLCEETRQKNLYAVHIVPSTVCIDPEQKKDKANGLLLCKEHARAYINQEFYFNSAGFVAESNNESIDCRMHLSFSILSKSRKKYLQAREAMMKKNVEF